MIPVSGKSAPSVGFLCILRSETGIADKGRMKIKQWPSVLKSGHIRQWNSEN